MGQEMFFDDPTPIDYAKRTHFINENSTNFNSYLDDDLGGK